MPTTSYDRPMDDETPAIEDRKQRARQHYRTLVSGDAAAQEIKSLISDAVARNASEIHISMQDPDDTEGVEVQLRLMGVMVAHGSMSPAVGEGVIAQLQAVGLLAAQTAGAQGGQCDIAVPMRSGDEGLFSMRLTLMPTRSGPTLIIGLARRERPCPPDLDLESVFPAEESGTAALIRSALAQGSGLVVVAAGSDAHRGTTLAAVMREVAVPERKVVSVETEVEMIVPGVNQVVCTSEMSYADAISASLRMDTDVIIVGDVADSETARLVVEASRPGRLVVAAVEANDVGSALSRLLGLSAPRSELTENLSLVVAQRLVRRLCRGCASRGALNADGCPACFGGYDARVAIAETFQFDDQATEMFASGTPVRLLQGPGRYRGFADHVSSLVNNEVTTADEATRVLGDGWNQES